MARKVFVSIALCIFPSFEGSPNRTIGLRGSKPRQQWSNVNVTEIAHVGASVGWNPSEQTDITIRLNQAIMPGDKGVYTGGKGVLVRNPFDDLDDKYKVFPATFWVNDIYTPSQLYPPGPPPECPTDDDFFGPMCVGSEEPWKFAPVAAVVQTSLGEFFNDFDNIQNDDWGQGVFYSTDSNSVDGRCYYVTAKDGYDCPGYWIQWDKGVAEPYEDKIGAGGFPAGNPEAQENFGGGAGCHFSVPRAEIDQQDATIDAKKLVQDKSCQCNYEFKKDSYDKVNNGWSDWVEQWIDHFEGARTNGQMPGASWNLDLAACWVNNPRDMINLQNHIWWGRQKWSNQKVPISSWDPSNPASEGIYWGWNEVPVDREKISNVLNWDAVIIQLPAGCDGSNLPTADCLTQPAIDRLDMDLDQFVQKKKLIPGLDNIRKRPGSYVAFVRQYVDPSGNWNREFYCQNFAARKYKVVFEEYESDAKPGKCYLDLVR